MKIARTNAGNRFQFVERLRVFVSRKHGAANFFAKLLAARFPDEK
jgi:hypothetical protein